MTSCGLATFIWTVRVCSVFIWWMRWLCLFTTISVSFNNLLLCWKVFLVSRIGHLLIFSYNLFSYIYWLVIIIVMVFVNVFLRLWHRCFHSTYGFAIIDSWCHWSTINAIYCPQHHSWLSPHFSCFCSILYLWLAFTLGLLRHRTLNDRLATFFNLCWTLYWIRGFWNRSLTTILRFTLCCCCCLRHRCFVLTRLGLWLWLWRSCGSVLFFNDCPLFLGTFLILVIHASCTTNPI